jgi:hypothetical protein
VAIAQIVRLPGAESVMQCFSHDILLWNDRSKIDL